MPCHFPVNMYDDKAYERFEWVLCHQPVCYTGSWQVEVLQQVQGPPGVRALLRPQRMTSHGQGIATELIRFSCTCYTSEYASRRSRHLAMLHSPFHILKTPTTAQHRQNMTCMNTISACASNIDAIRTCSNGEASVSGKASELLAGMRSRIEKLRTNKPHAKRFG